MYMIMLIIFQILSNVQWLIIIIIKLFYFLQNKNLINYIELHSFGSKKFQRLYSNVSLSAKRARSTFFF